MRLKTNASHRQVALLDQSSTSRGGSSQRGNIAKRGRARRWLGGEPFNSRSDPTRLQGQNGLRELLDITGCRDVRRLVAGSAQERAKPWIVVLLANGSAVPASVASAGGLEGLGCTALAC